MDFAYRCSEGVVADVGRPSPYGPGRRSIRGMKPYTREIRVEADLLHVTLGGDYPREHLDRPSNIFEPLVKACQDGACHGAVIDARELRVELDTLDLFRAGMDAAALSRYGFYVAFVVRPDMLDAFFHDVLQNRGALAGIFTEMNDAMAWIRERLASTDRAESS